MKIDLKYLKEIENYNLNEMIEFVKIVNEANLELMRLKDESYGGSWQKDGFIGAFLNLKRKIHRLLEMFSSGKLFSMREDSGGDNALDTFCDLSNYNSMNIFLLFKGCESESDFEVFSNRFPKITSKFCWNSEAFRVEMKVL